MDDIALTVLDVEVVVLLRRCHAQSAAVGEINVLHEKGVGKIGANQVMVTPALMGDPFSFPGLTISLSPADPFSGFFKAAQGGDGEPPG